MHFLKETTYSVFSQERHQEKPAFHEEDYLFLIPGSLGERLGEPPGSSGPLRGPSRGAPILDSPCALRAHSESSLHPAFVRLTISGTMLYTTRLLESPGSPEAPPDPRRDPAEGSPGPS